LDEHIPAFPGRSFRQHLVTNAHQINRRRSDAGADGWGANSVNWIVDIVSATSQMGTHLDALNHLQIGDRFYNGHSLDEIVEEWGTNRLGSETIPQVITRGLLVNIAAQRGLQRLGQGEVITIDDVQACLDSQCLSVQRGDALLLHTGWGSLWADSAAYLAGQPGPGLELATWLVQHGVALSGCDTWSFGPVPPEDPAQPFVIPQTLNVRHGLFILENLYTSELVNHADWALEFMFVISHAKLRGATGAWVSPIAVI
jgi:kynurenine formamidase